MSRDQALAFVEAAVKSPRMKSHLEGALGWNKVPETKDFDSRDAEAQDRAEELATYVGEVSGVLLSTLSNLRQAEIPGTAKGKRAS